MNSQKLYGLHPVLEALRAGKTIDKVFIQDDLKNEVLEEIRSMAKELGVSVIRAPKEKLGKLERKNHQGVIAFTSPIEFGDLDEIVQRTFEAGETPSILLLDKVSDVRNFGSIARSALSAGCQAIVIPHKGAAAINEDAIKTSAGALNHIVVCKEPSLGDAIKRLYRAGINTLACSEKATKTIYQHDLTGPTAVLFGSEGKGIDPHLIRMASGEASIPMYGEVGSLNVAVATGVILFEMARQRQH